MSYDEPNLDGIVNQYYYLSIDTYKDAPPLQGYGTY